MIRNNNHIMLKHEIVNLPTTRYVGSKQKIAPWIWHNIQDLKFDSFLDLFGGTGVVGYTAKIHGKKVIYNDLLKFNQIIGKAIIENNCEKLSKEDIDYILKKGNNIYPNFIEKNFKDYLKSAMSYCNAKTLEDFIGKAEYIFITEASQRRFRK